MTAAPVRAPRRLLALDTGSPVVSVALAVDGAVRATSAVEQARSSVALLQRIDACLRACNLEPGDLDALVVLRGPGSFTGLRVGMATAQGLRAALGIDVAVLPSLRVLAAHASERLQGGERSQDAERLQGGERSQDAERLQGGEHSQEARTDLPPTIVGAIDALRGEWFAQPHRVTPDAGSPEPLEAAAIVAASRLADWGPATLVGFGVERLAATGTTPGVFAGLRILEAGPLAPTAARLARYLPECWNADLLTDPLYLREPAVTLPTG